MTKRPPAATHPRAAAGQLLSIAIATLASKPNNARIVKESPCFIGRVLSMRLDRPPLSLSGSSRFRTEISTYAHMLSGQPGRTDVGPGWLQLVSAIPVRHSECRMSSPLSKKLDTLTCTAVHAPPRAVFDAARHQRARHAAHLDHLDRPHALTAS
jgi:hypothetical protein